MGLFDVLKKAVSSEDARTSSREGEVGESLFKRPVYEDVAVCLSSREARHALRVFKPDFQLDLHGALKGEPLEDLPTFGRRGPRSRYGALIELDNGNILIVRHRVEDGDKLGVLSIREAEGTIVSTEGKSFTVKVGSEIGASFGIDATAKVRGVYLLGGRLHEDDLRRLREDSVGDVIKAALLNPSNRLVFDEIACGRVEEAYARTSTNKVYRLCGAGDGTVIAESAFDKVMGTPSTFVVRMESLHIGQKISLTELNDSTRTVETAKVIEFAVTRGGVSDERFDGLKHHFNIIASPGIQDETKKVVETNESSR